VEYLCYNAYIYGGIMQVVKQFGPDMEIEFLSDGEKFKKQFA